MPEPSILVTAEKKPGSSSGADSESNPNFGNNRAITASDAEISQAQADWDDSDAAELRIALAMCGGIALTLYEAGVSHEIYRFYKAWEQRHDISPLPDYDHSTPAEILRSTPHGYREAFRKIPIRPVIDILTGASAGGINSVFLGSCVATGRDFSHFHDIWIDEADVGRMKFGSNDVVRGLLNTENLSRQMTTELERNLDAYRDAVQENREPEDPDLFVRLCRTHHYGHQQATHDAIGHRIEVEQKADVINFKTRHFRPHPDSTQYSRQPSASTSKDSSKADAQQIKELTNAALATSAFPGMFLPVFDHIDGRWYVDGGLWNNQPIDLAVEAIQDKPAFSRTHRCLLFVEPNPTLSTKQSGDTAASVVSAPETEPSPAQVVSGLLFMGLKGNIWPALESILRFNTRHHLYDSLAHDPAVAVCVQEIGHSQFRSSRTQAQRGKEWVAHERALRNAATDSSVGASPQVTSNGSLHGDTPGSGNSVPGRKTASARKAAPNVELTALNRMRIHSLLFDGDPALIRQWEAMLERLGYASVTRQQTPQAQAAIWIALAALKTVGLCDIEQWLLRRRLQTANQYLNNSPARSGGQDGNAVVFESDDAPGEADIPKEAEVTEEVAAHKAVLYTRLEQIRRFLYETNDDSSKHSPFRAANNRGHSRFRSSSEKMLLQLDGLFKPYRGSLLPPAVREQALEFLWQWLDAIRQQAAASRQKDHFEAFRIRPGSWDIASYQTLRLFQEHALYTRDPLAGDWALAEQVKWLNGELEKEFQLLTANQPNQSHLEVAQYLLASLSDVGGKNPIDLIRISGNDTYNQHLIADAPCTLRNAATPAQQKLAGEGLGHVTGFLENRWRRNDYIWGRLDACEILLRTLRHYGSREGLALTDAEYEASLIEAQTAILQQEAAFYKSWYKRKHGREAGLTCQDCQGLPRSTDNASSNSQKLAQRAKIQQANARLIGYGGETILDGEEPNLSSNLNYLVQATIRLARGSADKAPAQLDILARFSRLASYLMAVIAYLIPLEVHQRTTRNSLKWVSLTAFVVALTGVLCFLLGIGIIADIGALLILILKTNALVTLLIGCGAALGFRYGPLLWAALFVGIGIGARLGIGRWPQNIQEYTQKPGLLLSLSAIGALLCLAFTFVRWRKSP